MPLPAVAVPAFLVALMPYFSALLGALVFRLAVGLGFGIASYVGLTILTANLAAELATAFTGLPGDMAAMAYILQLDKAVNLVVSAILVRMTLKGMTAAGAFAAVRWASPS